MQHILFLISKDSMTHGGAEEIMRLTAMYFLNRGDDVHVFFLLEKRYGHWEKLPFPNIHLYYSRGGGKAGFFSIIKNFWKVHQIRFDYSFSSIVECTAFISIMKRCNVLHINKIIGRESTMVFKRFKGIRLKYYLLLYRLGYPFVDTIICQTQWMHEEVLRNLPWLTKHSRVIVVPNPVDIPMMNKMAQQPFDGQKYGLFVVACGRLHPVKGFDLLLTAFSQLVNRYPELNLVILGDGPERERLIMQAQELGLSERVHMIGEIPNVYPYFRNALLCAVTSHVEGFPNVLLQMMSQNERVVSTTCAGGIDNIKGLIVCKPGDVNALVEALARGLTADVAGNRRLFDEELRSRSIELFVQKAISSCQ